MVYWNTMWQIGPKFNIFPPEYSMFQSCDNEDPILFSITLNADTVNSHAAGLLLCSPHISFLYCSSWLIYIIIWTFTLLLNTVGCIEGPFILAHSQGDSISVDCVLNGILVIEANIYPGSCSARCCIWMNTEP